MSGRMLFAYFIVISLTALVVGPAYASTSSGPAVDLRLVLTIGGMDIAKGLGKATQCLS